MKNNYIVFFKIKILYISINDINNDKIIGPKINPSGPNKIIPPKIEKSTKIDGTSSPLPKRYAESILSTKIASNIPNNPIHIAKKIFP